MPVERRSGLRSYSHDSRVAWTTSDDAIVGGNSVDIAFAPNVTPITYNDPPSPVVDTHHPESSLFPASACSVTRRPGHNKKKPENHIPRPPNAFILFRSSFIKNQHVSTKVETNHSTLSKIIGITWQNLPNEERQIWHQKAKVALREHKRKFPDYAFRPLHGKKRNDKRKVREVGPKDVTRCAKIAELLVRGKKGEELDAAVEEFDKYHAPEVITRFEAPVTAQTFEGVRSATTRRMASESKTRTGSERPSRSVSASFHSPRSTQSPTPPPPTSLYFPFGMQEQMRDISASDPTFDWPSFDEQTFAKSQPSFDCPSFAFETPDPSLDYQDVSSTTIPSRAAVDMYASKSWTRNSSPLSTATTTSSTVPLTPGGHSLHLHPYGDHYTFYPYNQPQPHYRGSSQQEYVPDVPNTHFAGYSESAYAHAHHAQGQVSTPIISDYLPGIEQAQKCQTYATDTEFLPSLVGVQYSL